MDIEPTPNPDPIPDLSQPAPLYQPQLLLRTDTNFRIQTATQTLHHSATLQIWDNVYKFVWMEGQLVVEYGVTATIGVSGGVLVVFVDSEKGEEGEGEGEEGVGAADELLGLMRGNMKGNYLMRGEATVYVELQDPSTRAKAYELLSYYVGEEDEGADDDDDDDLGEMIGADDIDEHGDVIRRSAGQQQQQKCEGVDEQAQQQGDEGEDLGQQQPQDGSMKQQQNP